MTSKTAEGPRVHNGAYTVEHASAGHFTVKLYTVGGASELTGRRILALLCGPNNERDWRGVAFWDDEQWRARVWGRYSSDDRKQAIDGYTWGEKWTATEKKLAIWLDLVRRAYLFAEDGLKPREDGTSYWIGQGYTLLLEGRCVICNRRLTNPESIRLGIGPECRKTT